jgi:hypothetical protein
MTAKPHHPCAPVTNRKWRRTNGHSTRHTEPHRAHEDRDALPSKIALHRAWSNFDDRVTSDALLSPRFTPRCR